MGIKRSLWPTAVLARFSILALAALGITSTLAAPADTNTFWVRTAGGDNADQSYGIAADRLGNSWVVGSVIGSAHFGSINTTGIGGNDAFVAKYDPSGNIQWVQTMGGVKTSGGPNGATANAVAVDTNGFSYVAGSFLGTTQFGATNLVSANNKEDIFVAKLDGSGAMIWSRKAGGIEEDRAKGVAVSAVGDVYVTGSFRDTARFGDLTIKSAGQDDFFVAKYDSQGMVRWVQKGGGMAGDTASGIAVDSQGNCYVAGSYSGTNAVPIGGTNLVSAGGLSDMFVAKYDTAGNFQWVKSVGGAKREAAYAVAVDGLGNCYIAASSDGVANAGTNVFQGGSADSLILKYNSSGELLWGTRTGVGDDDQPSGIAVDDAGNCYITGYFLGTTSFGSTTLTAGGSDRYPDGYIAKLGADGAVEWADSMGGNANDSGSSIAVFGVSQILATGYFAFGPVGSSARIGNVTVTTFGNADIFVMRRSVLLPTITVQPKDQTVVAGSNVSFSVEAVSPTPVTYQWQRNGLTLLGETNRVLSFTNVQASANGIFSVAVTNPDGVVKSASVRLTVNYGLTTSAQGEGMIQRQPDLTNYPPNTKVTLTAVPATNLVFLGWSGDVGGFQNPMSLTITNNLNIVAIFDQPRLGLGVAEPGTGTVTASPDQSTYSVGQSVTLTAQPGRWYQFSLWSDGNTNNPRLISVSANISSNQYTAVFTPTVALESLEIGGITRVAPVGMPAILIDGQFVLTNKISIGHPSQVELRTSLTNGMIYYALDTADTVGTFVQYTEPFTLTNSAVIRSETIASDFSRIPADDLSITWDVAYNLQLTIAGGGTVTLGPAIGPYVSNSIVTLNPVPDEGWVFLNWTGDLNGRQSPGKVTMDRDKSVEAIFATALKIQAGDSSILADQGDGPYPFGTKLRLSAIPKPGSYFDRWGGAVTGTISSIEFVVTNANPVIGALFLSLAGNQAAVSVQEHGRGRVIRSPQLNIYTNGQTITLTAVPDSGFEFLGWSAGYGKQNPLVLTVNGSQSLTATFSDHGILSISKTQDPGSYVLTLPDSTAGRLLVQSSTNLLNWSTQFDLNKSEAPIQISDFGLTNVPSRFYRIKSLLENEE